MDLISIGITAVVSISGTALGLYFKFINDMACLKKDVEHLSSEFKEHKSLQLEARVIKIEMSVKGIDAMWARIDAFGDNILTEKIPKIVAEIRDSQKGGK